VEDMIGNLLERTDEWYAGPPISASPPTATKWPSAGVSGSYGADETYGITSYAYNGPDGYQPGLPAVGLRGGHWSNGPGAGLFALLLSYAPCYWSSDVGVRCVLPSS
jgi:formylglycine-generating enzyme required for sulfatase activity